MVLVSTVAKLDAFEELIRDLVVAGSGAQCREPVKARENSVLNRPRFDMARPTNDARHAETAFVGRSLLAFERSVAAVGPGERLGAVVGAEDYDGVVGLADVVQVLQQRTNAVVHLRDSG